MREFKVGDLVYYPARSTKIFKLESCKVFDNYPICIYFDDDCDFETFNHDGFVNDELKLPSIFHATPENHELLEKLYGVEFEKPPAKPTSHEIIKAMFERGDKYVSCFCAKQKPASGDCGLTYVDFIYKAYDNSPKPYSGLVGDYEHATPFDPRTGELITELP